MSQLAIASQPEFRVLPLAHVQPDPDQPRRHYDHAKLNELAASIRDQGVIQPIVVVPAGPEVFRIIAGERRWRASKIAEREDIPAIVRTDLDAEQIAVLQLVENLQRADLTLPETVLGCQRLVQQIGLDAAASRLGYGKAWVSQRATLFDLCDPVQALVRDGQLTDVEVAHSLHRLYDLDSDWADELADRIQDPEGLQHQGPVTRAEVREKLKDAEQRAEREARRQMEAEADRREAEQRRRDAAPDADGFTLTPPDDADDDKPAAAPKPSKPAKVENQYERERRLRAESWDALLPELRKTYRAARIALLDKVKELLGEPPEKFVLAFGMKDYYTSDEAPATAAGATFKVEVRGDSSFAGLVIESIAPKHPIEFRAKVTIAQLRQIEAITGEPYHFVEYLHPKGGTLNAAPAKAEAAHVARAAAAAALDPEQPQARAGSADSDTDIAEFLAACTQRDAESRVKAADLHAAYVSWCGRHGRTPIQITAHNWGRPIAAAGIEKRRSNGFVYVGIKLLIEADA